MSRTAVLACLLVASLPLPAHADELTRLLKGGPMVRMESGASGAFTRGTAIADVDAPADRVWEVLTDYEAYQAFMPRIDSLDVKRGEGFALVEIELDTPFVSTEYTNRYTEHPATRTLLVENAGGDLRGSRFEWRVVERGPGRCRVYLTGAVKNYSAPGRCRVYLTGAVKNYSAMLQRFEDDQQTITIGVNVSSLMQQMNAVKARAEALERSGQKPKAALLP